MNTLDRIAMTAALILILILGAFVFIRWQETKQTTGPSGNTDERQMVKGAELLEQHGCKTCHSTDGTQGLGPSFKNLYNSRRKLRDGTTIVADESYIRESILSPGKRVVSGFPPNMPRYDHLSSSRIDRIVTYLKSLSSSSPDSATSHEPVENRDTR